MVSFEIVLVGKQSATRFTLMSFDASVGVFMFLQERQRHALLATVLASELSFRPIGIAKRCYRMIYVVFQLFMTSFSQSIGKSKLTMVTLYRSFHRVMLGQVPIVLGQVGERFITGFTG